MFKINDIFNNISIIDYIALMLITIGCIVLFNLNFFYEYMLFIFPETIVGKEAVISQDGDVFITNPVKLIAFYTSILACGLILFLCGFFGVCFRRFK